MSPLFYGSRRLKVDVEDFEGTLTQTFLVGPLSPNVAL